MNEQDNNKSKRVNITIDHKHLESANPTTGPALYALGGVQPGYTLYLETSGPHEDPPIAKDDPTIHLRDGEKFYSEPDKPRPHEVEIIIDRSRVESPRKTTGASLYTLGQVPADYVLYREITGPGEDEPIPNDSTPIRVHRDEKFYSSLAQVNPGGTHG